MGYYTKFDLEIVGCSWEDAKDIIEDLRNTDANARYGLDECGEGMGCETLKWYSHEKDMKKFSEKYPDKLFKLQGDGEESGDMWIKYFQNGKVQICKAVLVFDEFNPKKLS